MQDIKVREMRFPSLIDIQRRRKALGMTQNQLAKQARISQPLLTKIERGIVIPNYEIGMRIFNVLESAESPDRKLARDVMHNRVIILRPSDSVEKVVALLKRHAISQFPVADGRKIVGSITSLDLLGRKKSSRIKDLFGEPFPMVNELTPLSVVRSIIGSSKAVLVLSRGRIAGIITAEDML